MGSGTGRVVMCSESFYRAYDRHSLEKSGESRTTTEFILIHEWARRKPPVTDARGGARDVVWGIVSVAAFRWTFLAGGGGAKMLSSMDPPGPASAAAAAHHASHEPYVVRSFRREDISACTQLYVEGLLGGKIAENDTGLDIDDIDRAYMNKPGSHFWVAETVGALADSRGGTAKQIIGMIGVQQHEDNVGEIRRLRVRQDFRRRGIGSALIEVALKFCRDRGYLKIALDTFMEREPAVRLFEKFHFRHSRTRNVMGKEVMHFYLDLYQRDGGQGGHGGPHGQPDDHGGGVDARP